MPARLACAGVAFEADGTILLDREGSIAAADASGLFLLGIKPDKTEVI